MAIEVLPLPLPPSADASKFKEFGREVKGVDVGNLTPEQFKEIEELLYKYNALLFRNTSLSPEQQYRLTKVYPPPPNRSVDDFRLTRGGQAFDPTSESYGHGNNKTGNTKKSVLHPDLKTIPRVPQVQLIGNGTVYDHEGLAEAKLKHPHHRTFHKTAIPDEEDLKYTRFYRWHIDAALYDLSPPKVTTLYAINVPAGEHQTCRYDDGTGDELSVPLGTTAFVSGLQLRYAPHPYVWMAPAHAMPTGLGIESEGLELPLNELPPWEKEKIKVFPVVTLEESCHWRLHFQVHPCGVAALIVDPLPEGAAREGALYPDGAELTDLRQVRELLYSMQRPAIAPSLVYPHDWSEKDLVIFHNRGVLHSVVGAFAPDQVRAFHQCNLAASEDPIGPSAEDVKKSKNFLQGNAVRFARFIHSTSNVPNQSDKPRRAPRALDLDGISLDESQVQLLSTRLHRRLPESQRQPHVQMSELRPIRLKQKERSSSPRSPTNRPGPFRGNRARVPQKTNRLLRPKGSTARMDQTQPTEPEVPLTPAELPPRRYSLTSLTVLTTRPPSLSTKGGTHSDPVQRIREAIGGDYSQWMPKEDVGAAGKADATTIERARLALAFNRQFSRGTERS
ncbi:Alpha-ketoglutarate dependent xanthine dioxygenase [Rhizoctonia solani]|uniref:Alpha-ketoglutarate dependent xanthine dioxygenase n=1 Tax=Rhizoctonia solani TaxID=456999 RepID=A0A8H7M3K7_9AGAM|nr:Alpha-ketoglutarate dependent xanthine dioxygenase [Rhizoctonia solani]